jgi:cytochrome c
MSDLTFNKIAGAVLATGLLIVGLTQVTAGVFADHPVKTPGYAVEVAEEGGEAGAAADTLPDWGTVLATADTAAGAAVFAKCTSCHTVAAGGANGTGPNLHGAVGRKPASHAGFAYSPAMVELGGKQPVWDYDHLYEYLKAPQKFLPGTKMTFVGLKKPEDRVNLIAYLRSEGGTLPVPAPDPSRAPGAAAPAEGAAPATPGAAGSAGAPAAPANNPPAASAAGGPSPAPAPVTSTPATAPAKH